MKRSIVTNFMVFTGALVLAALLCQIVFNLFLSKPYLIEYKKSATERLFDSIIQNYSDDQNQIYSVARSAENDNINILIFSDNGFIYSSRNIDIPMIRRALLPMGPASRVNFEYEPEAAVKPSAAGKMEMISLNGIFTFNGQNRYVAIETPVESIETSVKLLSRANMAIFGAALVVGLVCAFIFSRRFSKPIMELKAVAQNVASLKFDTRANEDQTTLEFSELSASINSMAGKLQAMIADLQERNESLQSDIDQQMRLDKMRREFVANVSHEFKTPLCLLMLYSENLKNNVDSIDKDFYCDTIIEEVNKLDEMAKSLLNLSAIENGLSAMKLEALDLSTLCDCVASKASPLFKGISAAVTIQGGLEVKGDAVYLEQAVKNYMMNAVSHTAAGGKVDISLREDGGQAVFTVFNEGKPISEEDASQLWESFYKTDKARVREGESHVGLGLYIVKTIVNAHRGAYGLTNRENGVAFWFSVPIAGAGGGDGFADAAGLH